MDLGLVRSRLGDELGRLRPGRPGRRAPRPSEGPASGRCLICGAEHSGYHRITYQANARLAREVAVCSGCGYVSIAELTANRYRGKTNLDELPSGGDRAGTRERPGREFLMARMGLDILGRSDVEVMVYGIGRSLDNHHIAKLKRVRNVAIGDIMRVRDDAEFHDANEPARKRFQIVVASEVVEHFRNPREDFTKLVQFVRRDGLLVCGTNIYAGGDLTKDRYVFWPDHTSYYTPQALLEIARDHRLHLDFRTPRMAAMGGRKRYVLLSRSTEVMQRTALYFGARGAAPSE